jgi:CDP-diacylglycerol--glycerol-3-phosphate 3-phosphatidyltransferase
LLDPIADKAMLATAAIGASILGLLSWWVTAILLFREIAVTVLRFAVIKDGVIPASKGAKLKTFFQSFGVGFYILPLPTWLHIPRDIFMAVAIYLTISTGMAYFKQVLKK